MKKDCNCKYLEIYSSDSKVVESLLELDFRVFTHCTQLTYVLLHHIVGLPNSCRFHIFSHFFHHFIKFVCQLNSSSTGSSTRFNYPNIVHPIEIYLRPELLDVDKNMFCRCIQILKVQLKGSLEK